LAVRRKKNKKDKKLVSVNRFAYICGKFTRALLAHQIFYLKISKIEICQKFLLQGIWKIFKNGATVQDADFQKIGQEMYPKCWQKTKMASFKN
jgi:hypothetical protein